MKTASFFILCMIICGHVQAQLIQPDFFLTDVNNDSLRNQNQSILQKISPRQYRQQISVYYFSQEWCSICKGQFTSLQQLSDELQSTTDLPIVFTGINLLTASTDAGMFQGKSLSWMRETATIRPWDTWRVPISSRPAQEIRWRDVVILDENNAFYAVQNLTETPITIPANLTRLRNTLRAAATIVDSDGDGMNDRWEFSEWGSISSYGHQTPTPSGLPALLAYSFALPRGEFAAARMPTIGVLSLGGQNYLQLTWRQRLGGEGTRLSYQPQISSSLSSWVHSPDDWTTPVRVNPYDGSGTEIVTVRRTRPASGGQEFIRLEVGQPGS